MVKVGQYFSQPVKLKYGVPQGSVVGPILFTMYTSPLKDIIQKHGISCHTYADDTQLYLTFRPGVDINNVCSRLEECICDIKRWMLCNKLKLNDEKTEVLLLGSPYFLKKVPSITLWIGDSLVRSTSCAKNLGVLFDSEMNMHKFVHQKVSAAIYYLRSIAHYRHYLSLDATKALVHAYVTSRLNYCFYCVNISYLVDQCICPARSRSRQTLDKNVLSWALTGTGSVLLIRQVS